MSYPIEDGIAIPPASGGRGCKSEVRIALEGLQAGQSILFPAFNESNRFTLAVLRRKRGWKFSTRKVDGGTRVWRIE